MPKLELLPNVEKTEVDITIDGVSIKANATQLEAIIEGFAAARAQLLPAVPNDAPIGQQVNASFDPRYWTNLDPATGGTLLILRHAGLGWLPFMLPPGEREHLVKVLTEQGKVVSVSAAAPPTPGLH